MYDTIENEDCQSSYICNGQRRLKGQGSGQRKKRKQKETEEKKCLGQPNGKEKCMNAHSSMLQGNGGSIFSSKQLYSYTCLALMLQSRACHVTSLVLITKARTIFFLLPSSRAYVIPRDRAEADRWGWEGHLWEHQTSVCWSPRAALKTLAQISMGWELQSILKVNFLILGRVTLSSSLPCPQFSLFTVWKRHRINEDKHIQHFQAH